MPKLNPDNIVENILQNHISNSHESYLCLLNKFNKLDFSIAILNDQLEILFTNSSFNQLLEELEIKKYDSLSSFHDSDHINKYLTSNEKDDYPFYLSNYEGKILGNYIFSPEQLTINNKVYHLLYSNDSDKTILGGQVKYKQLVEQLGIGITYYDLHGKILSFNRVAAAYMGGQPKDFQGKMITDIIPKPLANIYLQRLKKCQEAEDPISFVDEVPLSSGIKWFKNTYNKVYSENYLTGIIVISDEITSLKQAEKDIEDEKKKYGALVDNINTGIALFEILTDNNEKPIDFRFIHVNKKYTDLTQLKTHEIIGKKGKEVFPDLEQKWIDLYGEVALTGKSKHIIEHSEHFNKYWDIRVYSPAPRKVAIAINDITEQKKSEIIIKRFFEQSNVIHIVTKLDGTILKANKGWESILGYHPDQLIGTKFMKLLHPDDIENTKKEMEKLERGITTFHFENRYQHVNGTYKTLSWSSNVDKNDQLIFGIAKDITEEKNVLKKLKGSEEKFRAFVNNAADGVAIIDEKAKLSFVNKSLSQLLELNENELIGQNAWDLIYNMSANPDKDEKYRLKIKNQIQTILNSKKDKELGKFRDTVIQKTNGDKIEITESVFTFSTSKGNNIGVFLRDITELKKAEREIRSAYNLLSETEKIAKSGSWTSNPLTKEGSWSKGAYAIRGASTDIHGNTENHERFMHPDDVEPYRKQFELNIKSKGSEFKQQYRLIDNKGNIKYIEAHYEIQRDEKGEAVFITGIDKDITDIINAQNELKKTKEEYKALSDASFECIFISKNGLCIGQNKTAENTFGYSNEEALGRPGTDWIVPEDREMVMDKMLNNINGPYNSTALKKDGSTFPCEIQARIFEENGEKIRYTALRDITDRVKAEKALIESEERFHLAMKASRDGLWDWNLITNEVYFSPGWKKMLGYNEDELPNKFSVWEDLTNPQDAKDTIKKLNAHCNGQTDRFENQIKMKHKNGHYVDILSRATAVFDKNGKAIRIVGTHVDITKSQELKKELLKAKEQAEESDRLKSSFLANMSHEIRTPMNGILGFAELLKEPQLEEGELEQYVEVIERSGKRMLNIINDLIDISKIEAQQMDVHLQDTAVNEQIKYIETFFTPEAKRKNIELITHMPLSREESIIVSDREKIYAILTNLVKNAIKYTEKGKIEFGYHDRDHKLEFYVLDTGKGIPKDRQATIFERFVQAETEHNRIYEGAGLGLAISKAYVEMLGGKIWIEYSNDYGTKFCFTLLKKTNH